MDLTVVAKRLASTIREYDDYKKIFLGGQSYQIIKYQDGEEPGGVYEVNLTDSSCNCKDHQYNNLNSPCKHIIIAWLFAYSVIHDKPEEEYH